MHHRIRLLAALALAPLAAGCAGLRPVAGPQAGPSDLQDIVLQPHEALVLLRVHYLTWTPIQGSLDFHHDGPAEVAGGPTLMRRPEDWAPLFSVPTSTHGRPLIFKVKTGRLSLTRFNREGSPLPGRDLNPQPSAYARAGAITYLGDVHLQVDGISSRLSFGVTEEPDTVEQARARFPALFSRYPTVTYLMRKPS